MSSYKCWSPDNCLLEEEATIIAETWADAEDAAHSYVEGRYANWEYPDGPFDVLVVECAPDGTYAGPIKTFTIHVEYSPDFHVYEKS